MGDIDTALAFSRQTAEELLADAAATGDGWSVALAPGKWSPSQTVEHVARSLDASTALAKGEPCDLPRLPALVHPLLRIVFRRLLRSGVFPKGRTTRPLNPASGPATPAQASERLQAAHERYEAACRARAARGPLLRTPMFGAVPLADYVRFMALHTRHHQRQMARGPLTTRNASATPAVAAHGRDRRG
jgi:hypothetical protein